MNSTNVSPAAFVVSLVVAVVDVALLVIALVRLARTPAGRRTLPWPAWLAIIVLVHPIGAIVFLIVGRRRAPVTDESLVGRSGRPGTPRSTTPTGGVDSPGQGTAAEAIDELYGPENHGSENDGK
ncbi:PLD nuclease N-terminal domain-containing protein [Bifidobacterium aquikefiri]|jgi:hypothetical protein|uniref:PLD nuclease N-terminal domain-containing protein n=1 Tax=Actinomycetes TaxID=1760 RepID=UPI0023F49D8A|nr:PLD nuclease N-terminal domain-containing protein [Bifidobacterium aquikefiri]